MEAVAYLLDREASRRQHFRNDKLALHYKQIPRGSDEGVCESRLMDFWTLFVVWNSKEH
jgi:hypothetical protein